MSSAWENFPPLANKNISQNYGNPLLHALRVLVEAGFFLETLSIESANKFSPLTTYRLCSQFGNIHQANQGH